jgi:hypothetical protein
VRQSRLAEPEHRVQVGAHDAFDVLGLQSLEPLRTAGPVVAGVVDEDVEPTEAPDRVGHGAQAVLPLDEVAGNENGCATGLLDPLGGVLGIGLLTRQVADRDVGALTGVGDGHCTPDSGVPAGDERPFSVELSVTDVRLLAVVGPRLHQARQARGLLLLGGKPTLVVVTHHALGAVGDVSHGPIPSVGGATSCTYPLAGLEDRAGRPPPIAQSPRAWHCRKV